MGMLELWRAPKLTATSAEVIVYFSVILSFRHPSAHALACCIFMVLLPRGVRGGWVSTIYLPGARKENSLSSVSEGGISLYHPLFSFGV